MLLAQDTISAIATGMSEGGIGVVRISGPEALRIGEMLFCPAKGAVLGKRPVRNAVYGRVVEPASSLMVDEAIALYMPGPHSYTGEDVVELQCHGSPIALKKVLALTLQAGARLAEPGEFTMRAFLSGRIDLVQAEAVMNIIQAKSERALRIAVKQQQGGLSEAVRKLTAALRAVIVQLEAVIDYPDEDIEELSTADAMKVADETAQQLDILLAGAKDGRVLREGLRTVLVGRPNVGKSTLLNALLAEERAIVSDIPGTTRDTLEEVLTVKGIPLILVDTAGIRETEDAVEQIGVSRSKKQLAQADLTILLIDGSDEVTQEDKELFSQVAERPFLVVVNKTDLAARFDVQALTGGHEATVVAISARTGEGMEALTEAIAQKALGGHSLQAEENALVGSLRQEQQLRQAGAALASAQVSYAEQMPLDCLIIDLRACLEALGQITGEQTSDDILAEIFARFCIGK